MEIVGLNAMRCIVKVLLFKFCLYVYEIFGRTASGIKTRDFYALSRTLIVRRSRKKIYK